ncbi:hypothetical protein D3C81_1714650 [compost metagenome]
MRFVFTNALGDLLGAAYQISASGRTEDVEAEQARAEPDVGVDLQIPSLGQATCTNGFDVALDLRVVAVEAFQGLAGGQLPFDGRACSLQ